MKTIGKYVRVSCSCGDHLVDLFDESWNDSNMGFYECNSCNRPLIVRGGDSKLYLVGGKIK